MNRTQANEIRVSIGLTPLAFVDTRAQKRRQEANAAARAQANRDIRDLRNSARKGK